MELKPIRIVRRGQAVTLNNVPPGRTLLEVLREDLGCSGTKEGCGEGDCGACTVVLGELQGGRVHYRAINSCIRLAHSVDGLALWTVEDIAARLAGSTLKAEFEPISDMRASGAYRRELLGNLWQRFWLESQGLQQINLESFHLSDEEAT